jgi:sigma-B regulation protein RsbU (phosphoserine phosphatase)
MRPHVLKLRARFVLLVLAGVGLVSLALATITFYESREALVEASQEQLYEMAVGQAAELARRLVRVAQATEDLANSLEVLPNPTPEKLNELIKIYIGSTRRIYGIAVAYLPYAFDRKRRLYSPYFHRSAKGIIASKVDSEEYNYPRHDWFLLPTLLGKSLWTEPYFGSGGGIIMCTYCAPLVLNGKIKGTVVSDISLKELGQDVHNLSVGRFGYAFLLSRQGAFLAAPDTKRVMRDTIFSLAEELERPDLRLLGRRMIRGGAGVERIKDFHMGENAWLAFAPVQGVGWSLGVLVPEREVLAPAYALAQRQGLLAVSGLLLLCLVVWLLVMGLTRPLQRLAAGAKRLASGDLTTKVEDVRPGDEVGDLAESFNTMVDDLNSYVHELTATTAAKERIESELDLARQIQMSILPRTYPAFPDHEEFDLFAKTHPAREVGGDFYDFFFVDDNRLVFVVGDVSGKGVPAALFMTVSRTLIKNAAAHHPDPVEALNEVNTQILPENEMCMFVTIFYGLYELDTARLAYASAGHPMPLLRRTDGSVEPIPSTGGMAVGVFDQMGLTRGEITLEPGETLLVFTDGLDEAVNAHDEQFGLQRAKDWLAATEVTDAPVMIDRLVQAQKEFTGDLEQFDDLTLLIFRHKK